MVRARINSILTIIVNNQTILFLMGASLIVFIASTELFSSIFLALGYAISGLPIILAFVPVMVFMWWGTTEFSSDTRVAVFRNIATVFLLTLLISTFISGYFFDLSYDGQGYQQEAIIKLSNGWNPFYDKPVTGIHGVWINHYAKGPWLAATALYKLIGHIEHAKVFNLLYIYASFLVMLSALSVLYKEKAAKAFLFAALFALNPVTVNQSFSFYCDGQLASLLTTMVALSYLIIKKPTRQYLFVFALVILLALNIKFTAVIYVSIFVFGLIVGLLAYRQKETAAKVYIVATISYLIGLALIGFNPYITNTIHEGHPFYPLAGPKAINIIDTNMPADFVGKNRVEKLLKSLFGESSNLYSPAKSILKLPLTIRLDEVKVFGLTDIRIAGFGPLFGAITILSIFLVLVFAYFVLYKQRAIKEGSIALAFLLVILVASLANPEAWWARYAPQIWMLPLIILVAALHFEHSKSIRNLCMATVVLMVANLAIISTSYILHQYTTNIMLKQQLRILSESPQPVLVDFNSFTSNRVRFKEVGIRYKEVENLPASPTISLIESETSAIIPK